MMVSKTITREEFDARLAQSTEQVRRKRLPLEAQAAELEELIGRYSSVLERLETDAGQESDTATHTMFFDLNRHMQSPMETPNQETGTNQ